MHQETSRYSWEVITACLLLVLIAAYWGLAAYVVYDDLHRWPPSQRGSGIAMVSALGAVAVAKVVLCVFLLRGSRVARVVAMVLLAVGAALLLFNENINAVALLVIILSVLVVVLLTIPQRAQVHFSKGSSFYT